MTHSDLKMKYALEPCRLVMQTIHCFYCDAEDARICSTEYLFGIRACNQHFPWAKRDCKAYMHRNGEAEYDDLKALPAFIKFTEWTESLDDGFQIERSNGSIDSGWTWNVKELLRRFPEDSPYPNNWGIHVTSRDMSLNRYVPLENFLRSVIYPNQTPEFRTMITDCLFVLLQGVYSSEETAYQDALGRFENPIVPELPQVFPVLMSDGTTGRVLLRVPN
jgi:hypothetical protein